MIELFCNPVYVGEVEILPIVRSCEANDPDGYAFRPKGGNQ